MKKTMADMRLENRRLNEKLESLRTDLRAQAQEYREELMAIRAVRDKLLQIVMDQARALANRNGGG